MAKQLKRIGINGYDLENDASARLAEPLFSVGTGATAIAVNQIDQMFYMKNLGTSDVFCRVKHDAGDPDVAIASDSFDFIVSANGGERHIHLTKADGVQTTDVVEISCIAGTAVNTIWTLK